MLPFFLLAEAVTGTWLTDTKDGLIEIAPCGQRLCGRLVKSLVPIKPPGTDVNNPDPKLRGRPILGMPVLTGFVEEEKLWRGLRPEGRQKLQDHAPAHRAQYAEADRLRRHLLPLSHLDEGALTRLRASP
jgi:hypothetical protein